MFKQLRVFHRLGESVRWFSQIPNPARRCSKTFLTRRSWLLDRQQHLLLSSAKGDDIDGTNPLRNERDSVLTVPNLLCLSRIAISPYLAHLIINDANYPWALAVFGFAGVTDYLDGWIARNIPGQRSALGSFLDPLSDKVLMAAMYLSLTYVDLIPTPLTALVVSRDLFLIYAGLYVRYMSVEPPFTFAKYVNFSLPTAQVQPTTISKVNTSVQLLLVAVALCSPMFGFAHHPAYHALCGITGVTTFASAVSYAFSRNVYSFKNRAHDHQFNKRFAAFVFYILINVAFVYSMPKTEAKPSPIQFKG